jgi:hypothetical protein
MKELKKKRNRLVYLILVIIVIGAGLFSRKMVDILPDALDLVLGDILWALMVYLGFGMLFIKWPIKKIVVISALFCFLIEFSQLYHANWIDAIRSTTLGGLVLGYGFLFSDLIAYIIGIVIGTIIDYLIIKYKIRTRRV